MKISKIVEHFFLKSLVYNWLDKIASAENILNQARSWFLEITFVQPSECLCFASVYTPKAINNNSHEIKSE